MSPVDVRFTYRCDDAGMASGTITATRTATVPLDEAAARQAVSRAAAARKGTIETQLPTLTASFGSQLWLRLVGGLFISTQRFPVRASVSFEPVEGGTQLTVDAADSMGVGYKAGVKNKYQRAVDEVADALAAPST